VRVASAISYRCWYDAFRLASLVPSGTPVNRPCGPGLILASQVRAVCSMPVSLVATSARAFDSGVPAKIAVVLASSRARSSVVSAPAGRGLTIVSRPVADAYQSFGAATLDRERAGWATASYTSCVRRGKSGLHRAAWWVTPTRGNPRDSATENRPPAAPAGNGRSAGKGETVV
jgi:hypothetical protein